jgi:MFS transporter, DHA3 family, macrolide efflux protein
MLIGSLIMSVWGGLKLRIYGVLAGIFLEGICIICAGLSPYLPLITVAGF